MKEGLFLKNWEIAAAHDVMNFVRLEGYFELEPQELEVLNKLIQHIEEVQQDYEKLVGWKVTSVKMNEDGSIIQIELTNGSIFHIEAHYGYQPLKFEKVKDSDKF
jgi:hypothetical protein